MPDEIDIDFLRSWIGKRESVRDTITPEFARRFRATLESHTPLDSAPDSPLPPGIHWCLAPPAVAHAGLGIDGHPARGGFLPPVPLTHRMWASSRIQFQQPLQVNCSIEKASTIADVVLKHSDTSGPLLFVHIDHAYAQGSEALLRERQTIVYRQPPSTRPAGSHTQEAPQRNSMHSVEVIPDSTLLFRYSALTFNGHRIHYDHNYATSVEGYPGLVVQGPLTATLLMNLAQAIWPDKPLREFDFRGVAPAFVDQPLVLSTSSGAASDHVDTDSTVHLEGRDHRGALIMRAVAQF